MSPKEDYLSDWEPFKITSLPDGANSIYGVTFEYSWLRAGCYKVSSGWVQKKQKVGLMRGEHSAGRFFKSPFDVTHVHKRHQTSEPDNLVNLAPDDQRDERFPNLVQTPAATTFFQSYSYKSAGHAESGDVGYFDGIRGDRR